jgi:hypothetical protein
MQQEVPEGIADRLRSEMAFTKNPHDATRPVRTTIFQPEPGLQVAMAMVPEAPHAPAHVIPEAPEEPGAAPVAEVGPASAIGGGEGQEEGSDQGPEITTAEGQSVSWKDGRDYETQKSMVVNSDDPAFLQAVIDDPEEGAQFKKLARFRLKNLPGKD